MMNLIIGIALVTNLTNNFSYIEMEEKLINNEFYIMENLMNKEEQEKGKITIMYFYATWCNPCQRLSPVVKNIKETHKDIEIIEIDGDNSRDLINQYGIKAYPTLIILKDNEEKDRILGFMEEEKIIEKIMEVK